MELTLNGVDDDSTAELVECGFLVFSFCLSLISVSRMVCCC